eukprot:7161868-Pyramimonas_sp.AAC.1
MCVSPAVACPSCDHDGPGHGQPAHISWRPRSWTRRHDVVVTHAPRGQQLAGCGCMRGVGCQPTSPP